MKVDFFTGGKSVHFLQKKCRKILTARGLDLEILFKTNFYWKEIEGQTRDVLLMGDALLLLANSYLWPKTGNFRFWVLSESHKFLISKIIGMDEKHISVIPRHLIFKPKRVGNQWPDFSKPSTLVISSRLEHEKNIPFTLHFAKAIQDIYPALRIVLFSPSKKNAEFKKLLDTFQWKKRPQLFGDKGFNWHKSVTLTQPFLVNFSTYPMEDFSVSSAQAQELGWPLILSTWAVFNEIEGKSVSKINCKDIFNYNKTNNQHVKNKIIRRVVEEVLASTQENRPSHKKKSSIKIPKSISAAQLNELQNLWTLENRNKLVEAMMEPKKNKNNKMYLKLQKLLSPDPTTKKMNDDEKR